MKKVVIFGDGEFAEVARCYIAALPDTEVCAFTVHEKYRKCDELRGLPVVPFERLPELYPPGQCEIFVAIGYKSLNTIRAELCSVCKSAGYRLMTYVSPQASVSPTVSFGENCFVFENNVLQPYVQVGDNVVLWSGNHIGHHATIADHVFITSHAVIAGGVKIGSHSFVGINATIRDHISVGARFIIGAGALLLKDAPDDSVFIAPATEQARVPSSRIKL